MGGGEDFCRYKNILLQLQQLYALTNTSAGGSPFEGSRTEGKGGSGRGRGGGTPGISALLYAVL